MEAADCETVFCELRDRLSTLHPTCRTFRSLACQPTRPDFGGAVQCTREANQGRPAVRISRWHECLLTPEYGRLQHCPEMIQASFDTHVSLSSDFPANQVMGLKSKTCRMDYKTLLKWCGSSLPQRACPLIWIRRPPAQVRCSSRRVAAHLHGPGGL
jgi:hypothetical protein